MKLKDIFVNSFRFLVHEWKIFIIVLIYHSLFFIGATIFPIVSPASSDPISVAVNNAPYYLFNLLFWITIIPLIILSAGGYFEEQQMIGLKNTCRRTNLVPLATYKTIFILLGLMITVLINSDYVAQIYFIVVLILILEFLLFLAPAIMVLDSKSFIDGAKGSIAKIRNNFKESLAFYLILSVVIFLFDISTHIQLLSAVINHEIAVIPGLDLLQIVLSSCSFILYNAAIVGFYLSLQKEQSGKRKSSRSGH